MQENGDSSSQDTEKPLLELAEKQLCVARRQLWLQLVGVVVGLAALFLAISQILQTKDRVEKARDEIAEVQEKVLQSHFKILQPRDGAEVEFRELIRGITPFLDMNNYIIVTPIGRDAFVESDSLKIGPGGEFSGFAKIGHADAGGGERFLIRVLATKSKLKPGLLSEVPEDAIFSQVVVVTRKR